MLEFKGGEWRNLERLAADALLDELRPLAANAVRRVSVYLASEEKITLTGARHGRAYKVSKTGAMHIASAPGEPPAVLFDNLRGSVGATEPEWDVARVTVSSTVGPGIAQAPGLAVDPARAYARRLEWGGVDSRGVNCVGERFLSPSLAVF